MECFQIVNFFSTIFLVSVVNDIQTGAATLNYDFN